jgi:putative Ca2+/H+ antiporter (TMEM165/GDT1 family)
MALRLFVTVFATVFLAELGDKTQLATLLYASDPGTSKLLVFSAAATALVVSSALGVLAGSALSRVADPRILSRVAGAGFILIGIWTLVRAS